ncbi:MAG: FG-GAP repeat protein [Candidatus Electrothrix sp. YB6]
MSIRINSISFLIIIFFSGVFIFPLFGLATVDLDTVQKVQIKKISDCEYFGGSVSLSNDTSVIGSIGCKSSSSSAYVLSRSDNFCWRQQAVLVPSDAVLHDWTISVSVSGDTAIVGTSGAAYIFIRSGTSWSEQAKLTAPDGNSNFGRSVAISGDTVVVGGDDVYIFVRSGTSWTEQAKLTVTIPFPHWHRFVAISGNTVVIHRDGDATYIFVRSGTSWTEQAKLTPSDGGSGLRSVAISNDTVIVGGYDSAYIFVRSGTSWTEQAKLMPSGGDSGSGIFVAISVDTAIFSWGDSSYIFVRSGTSWSEQAKLTKPKTIWKPVSISEEIAVIIDNESALAYFYGDSCVQRGALPASNFLLLKE